MEGAIGAIRRREETTLGPSYGPPGARRAVEGEAKTSLRRAGIMTGEDPRAFGDDIPIGAVRETRRQELGRRALNLLVAGIGIVLTAPVMLVIAVAIRVTSHGPIIFRQPRVGIDRRRTLGNPPEERRKEDAGGRLFTMYKFRTMYVRPIDHQVWARPRDPRVTPLGRVLRAYRLDELPQLFNVLLGDMNVVGPRPEQPRIFSNLAGQFSAYRMRQRVLPGITGMAQVQLPYDQSLEDVRRKVDKDLEYIQRRSFWTDLKIMMSTVKVLLTKRGW